jgi:hypothetical protein
MAIMGIAIRRFAERERFAPGRGCGDRMPFRPLESPCGEWS